MTTIKSRLSTTPVTTHYRGDWFQTHSGLAFYHQDPKPEDIRIGDIAHALSMLCRFGGHSKHFYSVAQHSVLVSSIVARHLQLSALLHDATEAYIGDMVHPLKESMPAFREMEDTIWLCIADKFNLPLRMDARIKDADWIALATERRDLMSNPPMPWRVQERFTPLQNKIDPQSPAIAERMFLTRFHELTK